MSLMIRLGPAFEQMKNLGSLISRGVGNMSTTQKVKVVLMVQFIAKKASFLGHGGVCGS